MKTYLSYLLLFLLSAFSGARAQAPIQPLQTERDVRVEAEVGKWKQSLNLSQVQTDRLRVIMREQEAQSEEDRARLERAPASDEERLQQEHAEHMLSYDDRYDSILEPWQRERAHGLGLYHEHRRILRGLWLRWWWWPWWPGHHHPGWHRPHYPPPHWPPPPPRRPPHRPQPPLPPRPARPGGHSR